VLTTTFPSPGVLRLILYLSVNSFRNCLNITETLQYAQAKINTLRSQYLGHPVYWSDKVKDLLSSIISDIDIAPIIDSLNVCVIT
jgi:hypothetical protein